MFNRQKSSIDIKKSTQKVLDSKKDSTARLKHLKLILDTVDVEEAKGIFATHYSSIYHVVYESIVSLEAKIKGPVHQKQREELESILYIFEKILIFLPDLLHCRWQLHSLSRLFARLTHALNATRLRREAIRLFVLWYGALGDAAPKEVDTLYATIVKNVLPPKPPDDIVAPLEILGINQDKYSDNDATEHLLECLLDFMVTESLKHLWNEVGRSSCFQFVFDKFKMLYLLDIFPDFRITHDLYTEDVLALPQIRHQGADTSQTTKIGCQVVFVKWIANYTHSVYKLSSATNSRPGPPSFKEVDENVIAKNVILGTRENINIVHEVFRRALLYNFGQSAVIRRIICVYKDWIQMNVPEPPVFMLDPDGSKGDLKIGAQKILRLFFVNSSSVFMLYGAPTDALLEEQVDICKRVLNIYRYAVMNTRMDAETWEQLLVIMLHVTSTVLDPRAKNSLGSKLSSALFQTLIVSWVKASLNVKISVELWDEFQTVLSSLSFSDNLVTEWSKTMETLTRVLSRHVYNLDLANLPLDRLSEQKRKRAGFATKKPPQANKDLVPASAQSESLSTQHSSDQSLPVQKKDRGEYSSKQQRIKIKRSYSDSEAYNRNFIKPRAALYKCRSTEISICSSFTDISSIVSLETNHNNLIDASLPDQHSVEDEQSVKDLPDDALGIIEGGVIKGWLPSVAAVLWQRMLGVLGDVNKFPYHKTHAHFFQVLNDIWTSLFKIHKNLAVSLDNTSSPKPPDFVPPLQLIAPWCFGTLELSKEYNASKMLAVSLLCDITLEDPLLGQDYFAKFYACLHRINLSSLLDLKSEIVRKLGQRIIGKMLPGFTLMLFDLIHLSLSILATGELSKMPRMEASTLLANVFFVSKFTTDLPVLNPQQLKFQPVSSSQNPEICLSQILKCSKIEATSYARAIALQALTLHATSILHHIRMSELASGESPTLTEAEKHQFEVIMNHLISSVNVENRNICLVSADLILSLSSYADEIHRYFPAMQREVILGLLSSITNTLVYSNGRPFEKRLLLSLIMCLGEWCMSIPVAFMYTEEAPEYELLSSVFEALLQIVQGKSASRKYVSKLKDFNPSVPFDDLQQYDSSSSSKSKDAQPRIDYQVVQLAAKNLIYHLETQLGHFPIRSSDRCGSVVCENHDTIYDTEDMTSAVFTLPNLQMFAIDSSRILTVIELDNDDLDGSYVRFILRDLSGKACWDINGLQLSALPAEPEWNLSVGNDILDPYAADDSQQYIGSLNPVISSVPRLALRKRLSSQLPTVTNSAHDFDNLDDLLTYMAHSSPECFPTFTKQATDDNNKEDDVVSTLVNQRNAELQHLSTATYPVLPPGDDAYHKTHNSSFRNSRRFLSQLGFNSWEKRKSIQLLRKDEKLLRELKHLDTQRCRETHKIAVFYVAEGQEDKHSILCNSGGSEDYEDFVAGLGWEVELDSHCGFMGGLLRNKSTGETMPYYATSFTEAIFHVSTRMPSSSSDDLLQKTRHLGNDEVHIVWSEHGRDYRRDIIPTEFCDVLIVVYPKEFGLYRVTINRKSNVSYFGPLYDECVVEKSVLPHLVRCTAINASRAVRSSLQFFQHYFEQRQKSLETIMNNHQVRSTFENFSASLYRPVHPTPVFHPGSSNRASATSYTSTNTTRTISSPLLPPPTVSVDSNFSSSSSATTATNQFESSTSQESAAGSIPPSPTPPVPPKRLSVKLGSGFKPKLTTPPISPNLLRK